MRNNRIKKQIDVKIEPYADLIAETKYYTFGHQPYGFELCSGESFGPITVAYETYGLLNKDKNNAILITHALTGDAHVAGYHRNSKNPGWWHSMVGPGKAFDTSKYFIICSNVLGGCQGTTGPASLNPVSGKPYGLEFPVITIKDMVNVQMELLKFLGINHLLSVAGGSMGGMQALQWMVSYPEFVSSVIPLATTAKHSPQQIALGAVGRHAIMADPDWNNGNYHDGLPPQKGLSVARMIGHITYMSDSSMADKFGRRTLDIRKHTKFDPKFEVEGYLKYRGDKFVKRFDANSYLYITSALDHFDLAQGRQLHEVLRGLRAKLLILAFKSDWLYPAYQSQEIVRECKIAGVEASYCEIESTYGHDAFLLEVEQGTQLITDFLKQVSIEHNVNYEN